MTKKCTFDEFLDSTPGMRAAVDYANACSKADALAESKRIKRNAQRRAHDKLMRDHGLVKVRGALGGTFWE